MERGTSYWIGWVLSGLIILFLLMDAGMKFMNLDVVNETMGQLGYSPALSPTLGVILLVCTVLYAVPQTSVLGAILLTAYLGGAVSTHLRIGNPLFTHMLFGAYLGVVLWGGLFLRDARVRALIPFSR